MFANINYLHEHSIQTNELVLQGKSKGLMHQHRSDGGLAQWQINEGSRGFHMHQPILQINNQSWVPVESMILILARDMFKPGSRQGVYSEMQQSDSIEQLFRCTNGLLWT